MLDLQPAARKGRLSHLPAILSICLHAVIVEQSSHVHLCSNKFNNLYKSPVYRSFSFVIDIVVTLKTDLHDAVLVAVVELLFVVFSTRIMQSTTPH